MARRLGSRGRHDQELASLTLTPNQFTLSRVETRALRGGGAVTAPSSWPALGATLGRPRVKRILLSPQSKAMEGERGRRGSKTHAPGPWASCGSD